MAVDRMPPLMSKEEEGRMPTMCGCECWRHFTDTPNGDTLGDDRKRVSHRYMAVPAGDTRAAYVGNVCNECAKHLPPEYVIGVNPL